MFQFHRKAQLDPEEIELAECAQFDPELFFPGKGESNRFAKKICLSCEIRQRCLEVALANDERWGIFGGLSSIERKRLKRQGKRVA